ncbi:MAG: cytochrome c maturation protein CcmE [Wolbachia endosymbiont of Tyrophagus putrescentiae]|nr:cytochrome c maturation protein CcmE [Wolbachia endosymbiont of Tyrophagus putrescentiae]
MKRKYKRLLIASGVFCLLSGIVFFILGTLKENISFFYTVSEAMVLQHKEKPIRIGGMVVEGSVIHGENEVTFQITDFDKVINVTYKGILPPMFSEKNGIIVQGKMVYNDVFLADTVLAKHDENYASSKYKRDAIYKVD